MSNVEVDPDVEDTPLAAPAASQPAATKPTAQRLDEAELALRGQRLRMILAAKDAVEQANVLTRWNGRG